MPNEITLNVDVLLYVCGAIIAAGGAAGVLYKLIKPLMKPLEKVNERVDAIEAQQEKNAAFFEKDKVRLDKHEDMLKEQEEDNKMMLEAIVLLMYHAETGNHTGEVREGRMRLEKYLISR